MSDIVERLREGVHDLDFHTVGIDLMDEAANEIERLREALKSIGYDYVELSYEKVQWLYLEHIKIAKEAYQESFKESGDF